MTIRKFKYTQEEHARIGDEIYENKIRPLVEEGNKGKMVAIDIDSGEYEMGNYNDMIECAHRLFDRNPEAQIWMVRIGHDAVHRLSRHR